MEPDFLLINLNTIPQASRNFIISFKPTFLPPPNSVIILSILVNNSYPVRKLSKISKIFLIFSLANNIWPSISLFQSLHESGFNNNRIYKTFMNFKRTVF